MKKRKKRAKVTSQGGRPRTRSGDEVQLAIEFPQLEYAQVSGYAEYAKEKARLEGDSVAQQSTRYLFLKLWKDFWDGQPYEIRRLAELTDSYKRAVSRKPARRA